METKTHPQGKGLEVLSFDKRDFSHHDKFGTLSVSALPTQDFTIYDAFTYTIKWGDTLWGIASKFGTTIPDIVSANPKITNVNRIYSGDTITIPARTPKILNQTDLDFCTAFSTAELQYALFGNSFDPLYQMAKIKQIRGEYKQQGANLRDAAKSIIAFGSLPAISAPYTHDGSLSDKDRDFLANWANWPTGLDGVAKKYIDASFFKLDGTGDTFDNIRSTLWLHRQERRAVLFGLVWHGEWTYTPYATIPHIMPTTQGGGHAMAVIGQKTINGEVYLIFQQTWGEQIGDKGFFYFPRSIVNKSFSYGYGAFTFSRIDKTGLLAQTLTSVATFINKIRGKI